MNNFAITDLETFSEIVRRNAAETLSEKYTENLDNFISINQIISLVKCRRLNDDDGPVIINEGILSDLLEEISDIIYQVGLAKLCGEDKINCAWDSKKKTMVFWTKEE